VVSFSSVQRFQRQKSPEFDQKFNFFRSKKFFFKKIFDAFPQARIASSKRINFLNYKVKKLAGFSTILSTGARENFPQNFEKSP
jgi:hypothetical protein